MVFVFFYFTQSKNSLTSDSKYLNNPLPFPRLEYLRAIYLGKTKIEEIYLLFSLFEVCHPYPARVKNVAIRKCQLTWIKQTFE
jgi:hypothetical protein